MFDKKAQSILLVTCFVVIKLNWFFVKKPLFFGKKREKDFFGSIVKSRGALAQRSVP
jgi:hypothetical protein